MKLSHLVIISLLLATALIISGVNALTYTNASPAANTADYVKATTSDTDCNPYYATDANKSVTGGYPSNAWQSAVGSPSSQRFNIDLGSAKIIRRIYYENQHHNGAITTRGTKNFTFWGSNSGTSFADTTYADDTGWTQITTQDLAFIEHVASDVPDPHYTLASNTASYRYYSVKIVNNWGDANDVGFRRIVLQTEDAYPPAPVAYFTSQNITVATNSTSRGWEGVTPFTMQFTNTSTNPPHTSWVWNYTALGSTTPVTFNSSAYYNPIYTFASAGNYSISLNVTGSSGTNISTQITYVNVTVGKPAISFMTNVSVGVNPLSLYLNDTSTGSPTSWNTSWGDVSWTNQTTFPVTNITHTYSTAGSYWINEYATNTGGTSNGTPLLITVYDAANCQWSVLSNQGTAPFSTYFSDHSTNTTPGADTYYWDFGDGNTSTSDNLWFTYNISGTYTVNHSFNNGLSMSWLNRTAYITVGTPVVAPVASFYGSPSIGAEPLNEYFIDVSSGSPTSWSWDFGDSGSSILQNPQHTYTSSGFKTVNLTVSNSAGTNVTSKARFITVY